MNKQAFLEALEKELKDYKYETGVIQDVLEDHQTMIEEAVERGRLEEEYIATLSSPKQIAKSLKGIEKRNDKEPKIVALSPFIATIAFFLLGFLFNAWHPGWLVFLGIPIAGVLFEDVGEHKLVALSPFIATIGFFLLGTYSPEVFGIEFTYVDAWVIFFIIPIAGLVGDKTILGRISLIAFILVPAVYLYLQYNNPSVYNLLVFLVLLVLGLASGMVKIKLDIELGRWEEIKTRLGWIIGSAIVITAAYLAIGYFYNGWHPWWVLFLLIPMVVLYVSKDEDRLSLVVYSPFITTIAFILVGHYFNSYQLSWLFFLAIPILGVLEDK